jgi:hypothetical protein
MNMGIRSEKIDKLAQAFTAANACLISSAFDTNAATILWM